MQNVIKMDLANHELIQSALKRLDWFVVNNPPFVDRPDVVAHATVSAAMSHWPSLSDARWKTLLELSGRIREVENSRWLKQRRIAIAKLSETVS